MTRLSIALRKLELSRVSAKAVYIQRYAQDLVDTIMNMSTSIDTPQITLNDKGLPTVIITGWLVLNDTKSLKITNKVEFLNEQDCIISTQYTINEEYGTVGTSLYGKVSDFNLDAMSLLSYTEAIEKQYDKVVNKLEKQGLDLPESFFKDFTNFDNIK